ncbi:MeTHuselah like protein [Ditylenchus destructor]|uniref:MeTHuselah like protein n=1 Tax=Ditylenchus destructor TaxID=166010 RepID=A0AAD4MXV2_9BILA|nr:MeTHuselah like protein [Ditylenchus destructor]
MRIKLLVSFLLYYTTCVMTGDYFIYMELCYDESCYKVDINVTTRVDGTDTMVRTTCSTPTAIDPRERMRELMVIQTVNLSQTYVFCNEIISDEKRISPYGYLGIFSVPALSVQRALKDEVLQYSDLRLRVNFTDKERFPVPHFMLNLSSDFQYCTSLQERTNKVCACDQPGEAVRYCNNITNTAFVKGNVNKVYHVYGEVASPGYVPHKYYFRLLIDMPTSKWAGSVHIYHNIYELFEPQLSKMTVLWKQITTGNASRFGYGTYIYDSPYVVFAKSVYSDVILELAFFEIKLWYDHFILGECHMIQLSPFAKYCYCMLGNRTEDFCGSVGRATLSEFSLIPTKHRLTLDAGSSTMPTLNNRTNVSITGIPNNIIVANTTVASTTHLEELINDVEDSAKKETLSEDEAKDAFIAMDSILNQDTFDETTSNKLLNIFSNLTKAAGEITFDGGKNFVLLKKFVNCSESPDWPSLNLDPKQSTSSMQNIGASQLETSTSSIELIPNNICESSTTNKDFVLIQYGFRNRKLFPINEAKECELDYHFAPYNVPIILSAKLLETSSLKEIHQLDTKLAIVRLRFRIKNRRIPLHGTTKFAYWHNRKWVATDADIQLSDDNLLAEISHLTDFTLLVDGLKSDPLLCDPFLDKFSKLLNIVSLNSLIFLIFFSILRRYRLLASLYRQTMECQSGEKQVKKTNADIITTKILYYIFLSLFYASFTIFTDSRQMVYQIPCPIAARISYYFLLSCVCSVIVQSTILLKLFTGSPRCEQVLNVSTKPRFILCFSITLPCAIMFVLECTYNEIFERDDSYCWIRPDYTLAAVVLPLSGLIFHALVCFVCILAKVQLQGVSELFRLLSNRKIRRIVAGKRQRKSAATVMDRILSLFCIQIMLGLPWVFQYLAASSPRLVISHYIFTIAVGSQGILLFLFFVYRHCRTRQRRKPFKHSVVFTNLQDPIRRRK